MSRSALDEDRPPIPNPDELRARVALTPQMPVAVAQETNRVDLTIPDATQATVPDVTGLTGDAAHRTIRARGLLPRGGPASRDFEVVTQDPDAGTIVDRGSTVTMTMKRVEPGP